MLNVTPTGQACGAVVTGVDLASELSDETVAKLRRAWMDHHVLVFPNQKLTSDEYVRFVEYFGPIGDDPYINPIDGHDKIAAIQRRADETGRIFADNFHSDWSFKAVPPAGTCLYGITIPPEGGDTLFSNQHKALDEMSAEQRARYEGAMASHCAERAYATDGAYAEDKYDGSMSIRLSEEARAEYHHPLVRNHPESGRPCLMGGSYALKVVDKSEDESEEMLASLKEWQARPEFIYRHKWEPDMLVMWDNRSVLHQATGGFEGHARLLHRLTVADDASYYVN